MTALNWMPRVPLQVSAQRTDAAGENGVTIRLKNPTQRVAFFERAEILAGARRGRDPAHRVQRQLRDGVPRRNRRAARRRTQRPHSRQLGAGRRDTTRHQWWCRSNRGEVPCTRSTRQTEQMVRSVLAYAENRLRMDPGPAGQGHAARRRAVRPARRVDPRRAAATRRGARRVHLGDRAQRHLGGQPAVPRLHPGRADQGQPAVRHAGVLRLDPGHLLAGGVRRHRRREQRAAGDRQRGRPADHRRRLLRFGRLGRQPVGARGGPRDRQEAAARGRPADGCASSSAPTRTRRSSTRCGCWRWMPWWWTRRITGSPPKPSGDVDARRRNGYRGGGLHVGHDQRRHHRRPGRRRRPGAGAGLVVSRRRRLRRVRHLRPLAAPEVRGAGSRPTRSSSIRTSGCSPRSTAVRCCIETRSWPARRIPRTRRIST